jgi:hypothetical protein
MRLSEFTDPTPYTSTDNDTADCLAQTDKLWPHSTGDDDAPSQVYLTKPNAKRQKVPDARSRCGHISHE